MTAKVYESAEKDSNGYKYKITIYKIEGDTDFAIYEKSKISERKPIARFDNLERAIHYADTETFKP